MCLAGPIELTPGAYEFLDFLNENEIPFTIAIASDLYNLGFYFDELKLGRYFDISNIIFSDGIVKSKLDRKFF